MVCFSKKRKRVAKSFLRYWTATCRPCNVQSCLSCDGSTQFCFLAYANDLVLLGRGCLYLLNSLFFECMRLLKVIFSQSHQSNDVKWRSFRYGVCRGATLFSLAKLIFPVGCCANAFSETIKGCLKTRSNQPAPHRSDGWRTSELPLLGGALVAA